MLAGWSQTTVAGKKVDVYDPPGPTRPRFGILYLHGGGLETLADNRSFTRLFEQLDLACACPHGQLCWWSDRICSAFDTILTPEQHLLRNVVPFMQERWQLGSRTIGLLGI